MFLIIFFAFLVVANLYCVVFIDVPCLMDTSALFGNREHASRWWVSLGLNLGAIIASSMALMKHLIFYIAR